MNRAALIVVAVLLMTRVGSAAYIVEAHETGLGNDNFDFGGDTFSASDSIPSTAVGVTADHSIFGGDGVSEPDTYVFEYSPLLGDNVEFAPGTPLGSTDGSPGNGHVASGQLAGAAGLYNVYMTSPATVNVNGGPSLVTLTQEGEDLVLDIDLNNEGTGLNSQIDENRGFVGGLNNAWYLLGTVQYETNRTYSVTMEAETNTFVSQRVHGILWEYAPEAEPGDFDANGVLDADDINALTTAVRDRENDPKFDLNSDGDVDDQDRIVWVEDLRRTYFGDSNLDGEFNSTDFVVVFQAAEYEDEIEGNSKWETGDWNGDGEFDSSDFVTAFQPGGFEVGPREDVAAVPEPATGQLMMIFAFVASLRLRSYRRI